MLFYNSLLLYLLMPLRWIEVINFPLTLLLLIALSWVYTAILAFGKGWKTVYLLLPLYSFVQSMIILPLAIGRYCKLAWKQRSFGILNYELSHNSFSMRMLFKFLNFSSAALVVYTAVIFSAARIEYWSQHGYIMKMLLR
jgi:hypothetical protein